MKAILKLMDNVPFTFTGDDISMVNEIPSGKLGWIKIDGHTAMTFNLSVFEYFQYV